MNVMTWADRHMEQCGDYADAVVTPARAWSNGDIHDRSRRLATGLLRAGVKPGDRVVVWLPNGAELILGFSAAVSAGAAAVIVGDSSPLNVLRRVLADSNARVLITSGPRASTLRERPSLLQIIATGAVAPDEPGVDSLDDVIFAHEPLVAPVDRAPEDIAQIIYTSGTTGEPKGVVWTHETVRARYESFADSRGPERPPRRSLCALPLSVAFGAQYLYLRLLQKMSLYLLERFTPESTLAALATHRIEAAMLVPSICEALLAVPECEKYDLKSLRSVLVGGGAVHPALVRRFREVFGVRVTTVYGLTELGPVSRTTAGGSTGSVGKVRHEMRVRVVDTERGELPSGQIGDIEIAADRLLGAYYRNVTDDRVVPDDSWFRTGDVGYLDAAGELWIVGRSKDVIIQGGVKVYPQPIVDAIAGIRGVRECAIVGAADPYLGEEVVACVVRDGVTRLDAEHVLARCRSSLDSKHLPARVLFFPNLPRTDLGKVRITELRTAVEALKATTVDTPLWRQLAATGAEQRAAVLCTAVEARVRGILGRDDPLDRQRALGEMGVDSIGAVQLASSLSASFGRPIPPTLVFNHPTIDAIACFLDGELFGVPREPAVSHRRAAGPTVCEPVAIIGVGCRLPGNANSPDQLWEMLLNGLDATVEIDRWDLTSVYDPEPGLPRHSYTKNAALVTDADRFDAEFFSMNRREAIALDPQHRMALETSWHAIEDAGYDPRSLSNQRTAVFLGIGASSYESSDPIGSIGAMAPGRISHFLNLRGTALAVDATCSSSLLAIELAVAQLRGGQCDTALAGGVNVIGSPASFVGLSQIRALAADGRCKTFDASADGFGRGEGCVIFLLKRLEDARRDGDRVLALIRGVASNHDGRSSSLTAPNGKAQEAVIRDALRYAGVEPDDIDYLEAHGTGTRLGDPIEIEAAMKVFGGRAAPIATGSIKSNIGHLEAAAGAAGVLKAAMIVRTGVIPPNVHLRQLNPALVPYSRSFWLPVKRAQLEPRPGRRRMAGVTSMGMSGTNAHLVLEQPPDERRSPADSDGDPHILCISARDDGALRELIRAYQRKLASEPSESIGEICYTAAVGRSHFARRLAVCGSTREELRASLVAAEQGAAAARQGAVGGIAFLFSGEALSDDAVLRLYAAEPVYRSAVDRCAERLKLRPEELLRARDGSLVDAASFTASYALAQLLRAWGITPDVVMGQGVGEHVAACIAGMLGLEEGLCLARHSQSARGRDAEPRFDVVGGRPPESLGSRAAPPGGVSHGGAIRMVSTVTGRLAGCDADDAASVDASVALVAACRALAPAARVFVDVGPGMRLLDLARQQVGGQRDAVWLACHSDGRPSREAALRVLAALYMEGIDPAWKELYPESVRRRVALPTYPFQRKRYWHGIAHGKRSLRRPQDRERSDAPAVPRVVEFGDERVEATLATLVAQTLGQPDAPAKTANLVDAGVDSLRTLELLGQIARAFDVRLAPSDFNSEPTVAALARRIRAAGSTDARDRGGRHPRIVTIREGGGETPLICFHPAGGQVTAYMGLRGLVRAGCAIFAVQSRAAASDEPEFGTIEQMAQAYAELVASLGFRSVRLFGWSLGGVLAHAVAAVLERQNVTVRSVGMVDPPEPGMGPQAPESVLALTGIVYDRNPSPPAPVRLMNLVADAGSMRRSVREWLAECEARDLLPSGVVTPDEFARAWSLYHAHLQLIAAFSPRPIQAPLQLWWALPRTGSRWAGVTSGPVRERLIGGSHYTAIRMPLVQSIAEEIYGDEIADSASRGVKSRA